MDATKVSCRVADLATWATVAASVLYGCGGGNSTPSSANAQGGSDAAADTAASATKAGDSTTDATAEAEDSAQSDSGLDFEYCGVLDTDWGLSVPEDASAAGALSERATCWGQVISDNLLFLVARDCRISALASSCRHEYATFIATWSPAFLGCSATDASALAYGLIPACQAGEPFTPVDLELLSGMFIESLEAAAIGVDFTGNSPSSCTFAADASPLTPDQTRHVSGRLEALAAIVADDAASPAALSTCGDAADANSGDP
jgi:hypothetical protein